MHGRWLISVGLALTASAALAQPNPEARPPEDDLPRSKHFIALDADGDSTLSRSELSRYPELQRSFERMDRDKDGTLSGLEFATPVDGANGLRREPGEARP